MSKVDYYTLGKQFANTPPDAAEWLDVPAMSYEERLEFNRGYDDASKESRIFAKLFVAALVIITILGLFGLVRR